MKICSCCEICKPLDEFYKSKHHAQGVSPICKECWKSKVKQRSMAIPASIKEYQKKYREENKEKAKQYKKEWYRENKDRLRKKAEENRQHRKEVRSKRLAEIRRGERGELLRVKNNIRKLIGIKFRTGGYTKSSKVTDLIGCSWEDLVKWLGIRPEGDVHIDHICPCSQAITAEEFEKLQHYTNLRWLLREENLEKRDSKTPEGEALCLTLLGRPWID